MRLGTFNVLVVCTANLCRSPGLEFYLRRGVADLPGLDGSNVVIESAGIDADTGRPMPSRMAKELGPRRARTTGHRARRLDVRMLTDADLILTATREQRATVVRLAPQSLRHTWTMREFARYCAALELAGPPDQVSASSPVARLAHAQTYAQQQRGTVVPARPADDDVADPYGRSRRTYRSCAEELRRCAYSILAVTTR